MNEWTDKTAHQAEMELLAAEKDGQDKSYYLGEADFRGNLTEDPSRHNLLGMNATEYHLGWRSEANFAAAMVDLECNKGAQLAAEKETLKAMALHTEDVIRKLKLPSQRYRVIHMNAMSVWLNKEEPGFATFEAARLCAMDTIGKALPYDEVHIEDKGHIVERHIKEVD